MTKKYPVSKLPKKKEKRFLKQLRQAVFQRERGVIPVRRLPLKKTVKTKEDFRKYILAIISKFVPVLLLQRHTFEVKSGVKNENAFMECVYTYPYLNVYIHYSEKAFSDWKTGRDMIPYIVHEMCHPITDPLYSKAVRRFVGSDELEDERERLTDLICNIALNGRNKV